MKILQSIILFASLLCFSSCITIKDQIWVNKNGTGKREMLIDMSEAYPMLKMGFAQEQEEKKDGKEDDEMSKLLDRAMAAGKLDTIITPPQGEGSKNPYFSNQKVRLQVDDSKSLFAMTMLYDVSDVYKVDWSDMGNNNMMNLNESPSENDNPFADLLGGDGGDGFPKMTMQKRLMKITKKKGKKKEGSENSEMEQMMNMFAGKGEYTYIIHFPKKVKKISGEGIVKKGKKTVEMTIPLKDLLDPESEYNVSVKFK